MINRDRIKQQLKRIMNKQSILFFGVAFGLVLAQSVRANVFTEDLVANGNFTTDLSNWSTLNVDTQNNLLDQYAWDGQFLTLGHIDEIEAVRQDVTIPADAGRATLQLYYRFFPDVTDSGDYLRITVGSISETIAATSGAASTWSEYTMDVSDLAGQTVTLELLVNNNATSLTFADIDVISLTAESYAELAGTVHSASDQIVRNAEIVIKQANKKVVWTGTTNKKGKFTATGLRGASKKYYVIVSKGQTSQRFRTRLTWATAKQQTYTLD